MSIECEARQQFMKAWDAPGLDWCGDIDGSAFPALSPELRFPSSPREKPVGLSTLKPAPGNNRRL
jgi:hypothetical protein